MKKMVKKVTGLPSTIRSASVEKRILTAARKRFRVRKGINAFYEHGHWWITIVKVDNERTFDVVDAEGPGSIGGFDFELISEEDW